MANLLALAAFYVVLELRTLLSSGITRLPRYYGPLRHPRRPGLSLAGLQLGSHAAHRLGLPVLRYVSVYMHAVATTPAGPSDGVARRLLMASAFPIPQPGRLPHHRFRGLLSVHSYYGLHVHQIARGDPLLEGSDSFVTLTAASMVTGWSDQLPGGNLTH